jgi:hypothetical protein
MASALRFACSGYVKSEKEGAMKRYCEPVDGMVAIGMLATLAGGYFLFMASNGVLRAGSSTADMSFTTTAGPTTAMEWIEPVLGEAIVENELLTVAAESDLAAAVKKLNLVTLAAPYVDATSERVADTVGALAQMIDGEHTARVQYVLGRSLVNATSRGVRAGLVSGVEYDTAFNRRMIETAEATGDRLRARFAEIREPLIGQVIIAFTQDLDRVHGQIQQRIGTAVARVTSVQQRYSEIKGKAQERLALLTVAATNAALMPQRVESSSTAPAPSAMSVSFSAERSWPDVPIGVLILASIGLMGLFCAGLFLPEAEPESPLLEEAKPAYRKTA